MGVKKKDAYSSDFLIAEFNALQQRASEYENLKNSRVNFFLLIVAAVIATLPGLVQQLGSLALLSIALISLILLVIGLFTLDLVVVYSVSVVIFYQRAGRIRRWFVDHHKDIASYVAYAPTDDRPSIELRWGYLALRGGDGILCIVNSFAFATVVVTMTRTFISLNLLISIGIGAIALVTAWFMQMLWIRRKLRRSHKNVQGEFHFPYNESITALYSGKDQFDAEGRR